VYRKVVPESSLLSMSAMDTDDSAWVETPFNEAENLVSGSIEPANISAKGTQ
jgi:hypothetical protein